jgi:hypothetical protein
MRWVVPVCALALLSCQSARNEPAGGQRIPLPAGARVVQPLAPAAVGDRMETAACYAGRSADEVAQSVKDGLAADWGPGGVRLIPNAAIPGRIVVVAQKGDRGLTGVIEPARAGGRCAEGEIAVSLGTHHVSAEAEPGQPENTAGPAGPRKIGQGRAPVVPTPAP